MRQTRARALAVSACLLIIISTGARLSPRAQGGAAGSAARPAPEISYTVSMPRPHTHLLEVEMWLRYRPGSAPASVELVMPVWTPGSYLVREFARHVQDFDATAGIAGHMLAWRKTDKSTWRVEKPGLREVRVRYKVYSNERSVRTNELDDRGALWNNAALLMYPSGHLQAPSTLRVVPFGGWTVATGLPAAPGGEPNLFRAENFDVLYDSPFLAGNLRTISFDVRGVPHRIVLDGEGNYDAERLRRDFKRVVEAAVELMGDVPYRDYTFLISLGPTGGGGLEHLNSTLLTWRRFGFSADADLRDLYKLVAHEFFHLWNVKRIRPDALGPFDYTRENYTRLLWAAEGLTSYYEDLLVRRAGLMTDKDYLGIAARSIQALQETPGRLEQSLEEASFDAWIKYYRPDENTVNSAVSYYDKGAIVGMLLDLEIRRRSKGSRSLDDVMRYLYEEFAKKNRNYTPEDFRRAAERAAGSGLEEFFRRYVAGREELDYDPALAAVGLRLDTTGAGEPAGRAAAGAFLGATLAEEGGRLLVRNVPAGTPAYEQGINADDQIVAVDGYRATRAFLDARLRDKRPGDTLALTVFREDELRTFTVKLGSRADAAYRIVPVAEPTEEQRRNYQSWLAAPFPSQGRR
ncbi:MAG TPA: PDZ domain-containing protein [Pyrinomonadaceae bacterium]|nr:PDZ domain-containing protein [Pyrinomonadaceae bacterium]